MTSSRDYLVPAGLQLAENAAPDIARRAVQNDFHGYAPYRNVLRSFDLITRSIVTKTVTISAQWSQAAVTLKNELPVFHGGAHPHFARVHARRAAYFGVHCSQCGDQSGSDSPSACIAERGGTSRIQGRARWRMGARSRSGEDHAKDGSTFSRRGSEIPDAQQ